MGRGWKSFEVHIRKRLYCHEQTIKDNSGKISERKESWKESHNLLGEDLINHEEDIGRIWVIKVILMWSQTERRSK